MPKLSLAYTAGVVDHTRRDSALAMELAAEETREYEREKEARASVQRSQTMPIAQSAGRGAGEEKVRYDDIIKSAGKVIKAPPPPSPVKERKMSIGWGLARKKSVKGRGDRYTG